MTSAEPTLLPAYEQAGLIRRRELSSRELLGMYLERIERLDPLLNAVVTIDADGAMAAAARADEAIASRDSDPGPLHGLPMTVKDAIEVAGMRSTGGSGQLRDHRPAADPPVIERLRRAGAIIFAKTNTPEWSADIQTYNELFGTTNNPWDTALTPGGSSGGPATAVSAGLSSFDIGTDIGGSIRIPSSFCGVYGHKPTFGIVSQRGYLDRVGGGVTDSDINVVGPIARSAEDLDLLLRVMAGPNPEDTPAWTLSLPPPRRRGPAGLRVGLWTDDPDCPVDHMAVTLLQRSSAELAAAGAHVSEAHPPLRLEEVHSLFDSLILAAISVTLDPDTGGELSGSHRRWLDLDRERTLVRRKWAAWFNDFDVLICPVMPMLPFPHDQQGTIADRYVEVNGRAFPQIRSMAWTGLVGMAYLPSTVVPVGFTPTGLPVGAQVVGPHLGDRTSLAVARHIGEMSGGYVPPPLATGK